MYALMAREGYERTDSIKVDDAFSDFELRPYRASLRQVFAEHGISTVLDYGCGGSDWRAGGFDGESGQSAVEYFNLKNAYGYEPARNLDERRSVDCVVSFDVVEHVFVADVPAVLRDMFSYAKKLLVINAACYAAAATLPNGENAHVTVRHPIWWKGVLDGISIEYPHVTVYLICSTGWRNSNAFAQWSADGWMQSATFVIKE